MCTENHVCFGRTHSSQLGEGANAGSYQKKVASTTLVWSKRPPKVQSTLSIPAFVFFCFLFLFLFSQQVAFLDCTFVLIYCGHTGSYHATMVHVPMVVVFDIMLYLYACTMVPIGSHHSPSHKECKNVYDVPWYQLVLQYVHVCCTYVPWYHRPTPTRVPVAPECLYFKSFLR